MTGDELTRAVGISLGTLPVLACLAVDGNRDRQVAAGELVAAIDAALRGCPTPQPQRPFLVRDIRTGAGGSFPANLIDVNGTLFFTAFDDVHGEELWSSDGTEAGTQLVKDINPGSSSSIPQFPSMAKLSGKLFFVADDGDHGSELWLSDGSAAGTKLVKDINPGGSSSPSVLAAMGAAVFFIARDADLKVALWKSDGTEAGTVPLMVPLLTFEPHALVNVDGTLFFDFDDGRIGNELWKSDGTAGGTVPVRDINPGVADSDPEDLTNVDGWLFFTAVRPAVGRQLWKSDGTIDGTMLVKDLGSGTPTSLFSPPYLTVVNGTLFFVVETFDAVTVTRHVQLWHSDGTDSGTKLVSGLADLNAAPEELTNVHGTLFFAFDDGTHGSELWKSDGTAAGTQLVRDINPDEASSFPSDLVNANERLIFSADDGRAGREAWTSDGTAEGTFQLGDIASCDASSSPREFTVSGYNVFFSAHDERSENELWAVPLSAVEVGRTPRPTSSPCPTATPTVHPRTEKITTSVYRSDNGKIYYVLQLNSEAQVRVTSLAISAGTLSSINESLRLPDTVLSSVTGTIGDLVPLQSIRRTSILRRPPVRLIQFVPDGNGQVEIYYTSDFDIVRFDGSDTVPVQSIASADASCPLSPDCVPAAVAALVVRAKREASGAGGTVRVNAIVFPNPPAEAPTVSNGPTCAGAPIPCDPLDPVSLTCGGGACGFGGEAPNQNVTLDDTLGSPVGNPDSQGDAADGFVLTNSADLGLVSLVVFMLDGAGMPNPPINIGASGFLVDPDGRVIDAIGSSD